MRLGWACGAQAHRDRQVTVRIGALSGPLTRARATDDAPAPAAAVPGVRTHDLRGGGPALGRHILLCPLPRPCLPASAPAVPSRHGIGKAGRTDGCDALTSRDDKPLRDPLPAASERSGSELSFCFRRPSTSCQGFKINSLPL